MLEQFYYLFALLFPLGGLAILDWRYTLAFWHDAHRTLLTLGIGVAVFIVWDILGIGMGIFFHGGSSYTLPFTIAPEFPLEELFFLILLCYVTLLLFIGGTRLWRRI